MSLYTASTKRNRLYERKFDHEEARRLREAGMTYRVIARLMGVSPQAVRRICNPAIRERMQKHSSWYLMSGTCEECGGACNKYGSRQRCQKCAGKARRTSFRYDAGGNLIQIRCFACREWQTPDFFSNDKNAPEGKRNHCRSCGTKARRDYRHRNLEREREYAREWARRKRWEKMTPLQRAMCKTPPRDVVRSIG